MAIKNIRPPSSIPPLPSLSWVLARQPLWDHLRRIWDQFAGRPNVFGDNIPVGTPSTGTGGSSGGTTNTVVKFTGAGDVATIGNSTITDDGTVVTINTSTAVRRTLADSVQLFVVTGTMPTAPTTTILGTYINITSAGSAAQQQEALRILLGAGYTGSSASQGLSVTNNAAGTSTDFTGVVGGNAAIFARANSTTTGVNIGVIADVINEGTGKAIGLLGRANAASAGGAQRIGVIGLARETTNNTGGYFGLASANPTIPDGGLVADNGGTTSPIFISRDNGSTVFSVIDGGQHNFTSDATRSQHTGIKTLTEGAATSIVTVGVPSGSVIGFIVEWTVEANDATDYQSRCGSTYVAVVNKAGTLTTNVSDIGTSAIAVSAGTLTVATSAATGTNDVSFQLNATSSLTQTTLSATYFIRKMRGTGSISPL